MKKGLLLLILLFILSISSSMAQIGTNWKWLHEKPQGNTIRWVKVFDANTWYAAGYGGTFMKTTDAGNTWFLHYNAAKLSVSMVPGSLYAGWFFSKDTGFVVGSNGSIYFTSNAGLSFDSVAGLPTTYTIYGICFANRLKGYACALNSSTSLLLQTTDGGVTWVANSFFPSTSATYYDIVCPDINTILTCSSTGNVVRSTDGGNTFSTISTGVSGALYKMNFWNSTTGLVVGSGSTVKLTTDAGVTWTSVATAMLGGSSTFYNVTSNNGTIYLTGSTSPNLIFTSTNQGTSWDSLRISPNKQKVFGQYYCADVSGNTAIFAGQYGLFNSRINGINTIYTTISKTGSIYDIWGNSSGNIVTVGSTSATGIPNDQIMNSPDGGTTWQISSQSPLTTAVFYSLKMIGNIGYAAGSLGVVYKTTNGGLDWVALTTPVPSTHIINKIDFVDANTGWVFSFTGTSGTAQMWKTTDGGNSWIAQSFSTAATNDYRIYSACMVNANYGWVITSHCFPWKTTDGGNTWAQQSFATGSVSTCYRIQMFDTLKGYICGQGRLFRTTNGGAVWDSIFSPLTFSQGTMWTSMAWKNFTSGIICGTASFSTTNGGSSWSYNLPGNGTYYNMCCYGTDTTNFLLGGTFGYIHKWANFSLPVELTSLNAATSGNNVTLIWSTATELNNKGFDIQRKLKDGEFIDVGFINGHGTTANISSYSYIDKNVPQGIYNYRIRQIDYDGTAKYYSLSESVKIGADCFALDQNYPNPFNPSTVISYSTAKTTPVSIKIYNSVGQQVALLVNEIKTPGNYKITFNAGKVASGVYFYKMIAGDYVSVKKMTVIK